jgi:hypothetical protein
LDLDPFKGRQSLRSIAGPAAPHHRDPRQPRRRIAEAECEGWLGEIEGLKISLAGANDKLGQIDLRSVSQPADLGMPSSPPPRQSVNA